MADHSQKCLFHNIPLKSERTRLPTAVQANGDCRRLTFFGNFVRITAITASTIEVKHNSTKKLIHLSNNYWPWKPTMATGFARPGGAAPEFWWVLSPDEYSVQFFKSDLFSAGCHLTKKWSHLKLRPIRYIWFKFICFCISILPQKKRKNSKIGLHGDILHDMLFWLVC